MNRLIIIGNGFDLAHGLKTDYNSFIVWYLKKCFAKALNGSSGSYEYNDKLIGIIRKSGLNLIPHPYNSIDNFIDHAYEHGFSNLLNERIDILGDKHYNPFKLIFKSKFSEELISRCSNKNWVDIENEFYKQLKSCIRSDGKASMEKLLPLNSSLEFIASELKQYLSSLTYDKFSAEYENIFSSYILKDEIVIEDLDKNSQPQETLLLNFNYTPTLKSYLNQFNSILNDSEVDFLHIHGEIDNAENQIIFGFGDELDEDYSKIEHTNENAFLKYIKSFGYFNTKNYHKLLRFIYKESYQIFILGHSCGLSDRTLLSMLFSHDKCKSIKIYHYESEIGKTNHIHLTHEISRHFQDKNRMRAVIVPFDKEARMHQLK